MKAMMLYPPSPDDFCRSARWETGAGARVLSRRDWRLVAAAVLENEGTDARRIDCGTLVL